MTERAYKEKNTMEIRIYITGGQIYSFLQESPEEAGKMLDNINPKRLFSQPQIIIRGPDSTDGFTCSRIECIEFITDIHPHWGVPGRSDLPILLSKRLPQKGLALTDNGKSKHDETNPGKTDKRLNVRLSFIMRSGRRFVVAFEQFSWEGFEHRLRANIFPNTEGLIARRMDQGYAVLNSYHIVHWSIKGGVDDIGPGIWKGTPIFLLT